MLNKSGRSSMRRYQAHSSRRAWALSIGLAFFSFSLVLWWLLSGRLLINQYPTESLPVLVAPAQIPVVPSISVPRAVLNVAPSVTELDWANLDTNGQLLTLQQDLDRLHEVLPPQLNYDWYQTTTGAMLVLSADPLFAPGDFVLRTEQLRAIQVLAELINKMPVLVAVAGHVDDRGLSAEAAWQVTSRRAAALASELERGGIAVQRLSAAGYAGALPQVPNDTADQRAINRRMELILTVLSDIPKVESASADTLETTYTE